jgi:type II secretory pathway pseudopilin PulG
MKIYLNLLTKKANSGFTLIELILASIGMFFVVMAAGYGVFVMSRENVAASAASETQYNLNRAVDFISEEIKTASALTTNATLSTSVCGSTWASTASDQVVLGLTIPTGSGTNVSVVYYTKTPSTTWLGSNAIYRCGPELNSDGQYTASFNSHLLVDLIANAPLSTGCPGTINNGGTTGWTQSPSSGQKGFYVCLQNVATGQRKLAEIRASASALNTQKTTGLNSATVTGSRFYDRATYEVVTQALARSN